MQRNHKILGGVCLACFTISLQDIVHQPAAAVAHQFCRQARQNYGTAGNGGGMAGMGFEQPSPSGLQLAGQLSPLQESSFTPHRTQPKNNLRQLLGNTGTVFCMCQCLRHQLILLQAQ